MLQILVDYGIKDWQMDNMVYYDEIQDCNKTMTIDTVEYEMNQR